MSRPHLAGAPDGLDGAGLGGYAGLCTVLLADFELGLLAAEPAVPRCAIRRPLVAALSYVQAGDWFDCEFAGAAAEPKKLKD